MVFEKKKEGELMQYLICFVVFGMTITAYVLGYLHGKDTRDKELSARVIRPANIKIEKHYHVTEYTVQDGALDIDFPNDDTADARNLI